MNHTMTNFTVRMPLACQNPVHTEVLVGLWGFVVGYRHCNRTVGRPTPLPRVGWERGGVQAPPNSACAMALQHRANSASTPTPLHPFCDM